MQEQEKSADTMQDKETLCLKRCFPGKLWEWKSLTK